MVTKMASVQATRKGQNYDYVQVMEFENPIRHAQVVEGYQKSMGFPNTCSVILCVSVKIAVALLHLMAHQTKTYP